MRKDGLETTVPLVCVATHVTWSTELAKRTDSVLVNQGGGDRTAPAVIVKKLVCVVGVVCAQKANAFAMQR